MKVRTPHIEPPGQFIAESNPQLDHVVLRALATDPGRRFSNGQRLPTKSSEGSAEVDGGRQRAPCGPFAVGDR